MHTTATQVQAQKGNFTVPECDWLFLLWGFIPKYRVCSSPSVPTLCLFYRALVFLQLCVSVGISYRRRLVKSGGADGDLGADEKRVTVASQSDAP